LPAGTFSQQRSKPGIDVGVDGRDIELTRSSNRHRRRHELSRIAKRGLAKVAGNHLVDQPEVHRPLCRNRIAAGNEFQRSLNPDESRQALSAARTGQETQLDLGKPDPRTVERHAIVAGERNLQAAAERRAVQCRNNELFRSLDLITLLWRLPEFGNVGAGNESAALANDENRLAVIVLSRANGALDPLPHRVREGINRRIIDCDYANSGDNFVTDFSIHCGSFSDSIGPSCTANSSTRRRAISVPCTHRTIMRRN
jgi:hypothetical protein